MNSGDEEEEVGVMDLGSGEGVCARPACVRSVGFSQLPAPPRPVWRYSGAGWEAESARARSAVAGGSASGSWACLLAVCIKGMRWEEG